MHDALERVRYLSHVSQTTGGDLVELLPQHPELIDDWVAYSQDKCTSGGWYLDDKKIAPLTAHPPTCRKAIAAKYTTLYYPYPQTRNTRGIPCKICQNCCY